MAVRGNYSDMEKRILEKWNREADSRAGWTTAKGGFSAEGGYFMDLAASPVITKEEIIGHSSDVDPWNPLWNLEGYAAASRWGGLMAHPLFAERLTPFPNMMQTEEGLFLAFHMVGWDVENFQPVRPGDATRVYAHRPTMEDVTDVSGRGPREFRSLLADCDIINQRNEIAGTYKMLITISLHEGLPPMDKHLEPYGFTTKEIDFIADVAENERIRGSEILYWEDVNVGDSLGAVTTGPTQLRPLVMPTLPLPPGQVPPRSIPRFQEPLQAPLMGPYVPDRDTGLIYPNHGGRHTDHRAAQFEGGGQAWLFNFVAGAYPQARLITNWMGDDGFLCKYLFRHVWRTPLGDALIIHGRVEKKYIENGEHLVDVKAWSLDLRGAITDMSSSTVKLVSKDDPYPDVEKVINR